MINNLEKKRKEKKRNVCHKVHTQAWMIMNMSAYHLYRKKLFFPDEMSNGMVQPGENVPE